jgi:hypothetical protein
VNQNVETLPRDSTPSGLDWVSKTAGEINYGRLPDFSLPCRVEISEFSVIQDFLRFFSVEVEKEATDFYTWALNLGETAFQGQLGDDTKYWSIWRGGPCKELFYRRDC